MVNVFADEPEVMHVDSDSTFTDASEPESEPDDELVEDTKIYIPAVRMAVSEFVRRTAERYQQVIDSATEKDAADFAQELHAMVEVLSRPSPQ